MDEFPRQYSVYTDAPRNLPLFLVSPFPLLDTEGDPD
jgi:hypothetical protein